MKVKTFFDDICYWPYYQPYGEVPVPKPKRRRKPRKRNPYSALIARSAPLKDEREVNQLIKLLRR